MPRIPTRALRKCRELFVRLKEFRTRNDLVSLFTYNEQLRSFSSEIHDGGSPDEIVQNFINTFENTHVATGEFLIVVIIEELAKRYSGQLRDEINAILRVIQAESIVTDEAVTDLVRFENREVELKNAQNHIDGAHCVQIYGPGGLGKTWFITELRRLVKNTATILWFDFASDEHRSCTTEEAFLSGITDQLGMPTGSFQRLPSPSERLLEAIQNRFLDEEKVILFIDNVDRADRFWHQWFQTDFLLKVKSSTHLSIILTSQDPVKAWENRDYIEFHELPLSGFGKVATKSLLDQYIQNHGRESARRLQRSDNWQEVSDSLVSDLIAISRGHPLVLVEVLQFINRRTGFRDSSVIQTHWSEIQTEVIRNLIRVRILPTIDASSEIREVFRSLCIFRKISPGLLLALSEESDVTEHDDDWRIFIGDPVEINLWWQNLKRVHLINPPKYESPYFKISPIVRQLVAQSLKAENPMLFRSRNRRATQIYANMLDNELTATLILEHLYHTICSIEPEELNSEQILETFKENASLMLSAEADNGVAFIEKKDAMRNQLREDSELARELSEIAPSLFDDMHSFVDNFSPSFRFYPITGGHK